MYKKVILFKLASVQDSRMNLTYKFIQNIYTHENDLKTISGF